LNEKKATLLMNPVLRLEKPGQPIIELDGDDLGAVLMSLMIEGLLLLDTGAQRKILSGMEIELVQDVEGRYILRPAAKQPANGQNDWNNNA